MEIKDSKLTNEKSLFSTKEYKKGDIIYMINQQEK